MPSDLAIIGLTYDGTDIQDYDNGLFLEIVSGIYEGVDVRGEDIIVPYLAGQIPQPRRRNTRQIVLAGHVRGIGATQDARRLAYAGLRLSLNEPNGLFALDRMPATLEATYSDLTVRTIEARPIAIIPVVQIPEEFADMTINLVSTDPDWAVGS